MPDEPSQPPLLPGETDTPKERRHLKWLTSWVATWNRLHPSKKKAIKIIGGVATAVAAAAVVYPTPAVPCVHGFKLGMAQRVLSYVGLVESAGACTTPSFPGGGTDITLPVAILTTPDNGAAISGVESLGATATDDVAVSNVKFYIDGILLGTGALDFGLYSLNLDTSTLSNGPHTITAVATDSSGNTSVPTSVNVTYTVANTNVSITQADIWVAPGGTHSGYDCGGSAPCAFSSTYAYGTFAAAFAAAQGGDTIGIACANSGNGVGTGAATYGSQTLAYNATVNTAASTVTIAPLDGCTPTIGAWTTLTNDYHPLGYYQSCQVNTAPSQSGGCSGAAGDATITVASTTNFTVPGTIVPDTNIFDGITCTGKTSTTFTGCGTGTTKDIYVRGGMNVPVTDGSQLDFGDASYVHVQGINATIVNLDSTLAHQGLNQQYTDATAIATLGVSGTMNATVKNVVIGPNQASVAIATLVAPFISGTFAWDPTSVLFDHVTWNSDNTNACISLTNTWCHGEAVFLRYANGITFRHSKWIKAEQYSIFNSAFNSSSANSRENTHEAENVLIENNYFGPASCKTGGNATNASTTITYPCHGAVADYSLVLNANGGKDYSTCATTACWTVRFNTFADSVRDVNTITNTSPSKMVFSSNYMRGQVKNDTTQCPSEWTYDHNVTTLTACTGTGNTGSTTWDVTNENNVDFSIGTSASAKDKGTTTAGAYPADDYPGTSRPQGSASDAGAFEYVTAGGGNSGSGGSGLALGLSINQSFSSHGTTRYYDIYKPSNLNDQCNGASGQHCSGVPLVVFKHGSMASGCKTVSGNNTFTKIVNCDLGTTPYSTTGTIGKSLWPKQCDAVGCIAVFPINFESAHCFYPDSVNVSNACRAGGIDSNDSVFLSDLLSRVETSGTVGANIDTTKIYMTGFSSGSIGTGLVYCSQSPTGAFIANFNSGNPPVSLDDFSGANEISNLVTGGFGSSSGTLMGGFFNAGHTNNVVDTCTFPAAATPVILVSSKGDGTQPVDPARSPAGSACQFTGGTVGNVCSPREDYVESLFRTQYSCSAETNVTVSSPTYTTFNQHDLPGCSNSMRFRWISLGSATNNAPGHDLTQYSNGFPAATNGEAGGEAQYMWDYWQGTN